MSHTINNFFYSIKKYIVTHRYTIYLAVPFLLMDIITRIFGYKIGYFPTFYPAPNIFTLVWIFLFLGVVTCLRGIGSKIIDIIIAYVDKETPIGGRSSIQLIAEKGKERFYEKRGFKTIPHEFCGSGMRKVIRK